MSLGGPIEIDQRRFRFYLDDSETSSPNDVTAIAAEDADITQEDHALDTNLILRLAFQEYSAAGSTLRPPDHVQLQYRVTPDGGSAGSWTDVNGSSSVVRSSASPIADGAALTRLLTQLNTNTFVDGKFDEADGFAGVDNMTPVWGVNTDTECAWCFQIRSADVSPSDLIEFRGIDGEGPFDQYTVTPSYTVAAAVTGNMNLPLLGVG